MPEMWIPSGVAGTRATLEVMDKLADEGAVGQVFCRRFPLFRPEVLDEALRARWKYLPNTDQHQVVRSVDHMLKTYAAVGYFHGSCVDAAIFAASAMILRRRSGLADPDVITFVALRPPESPEFTHVLTSLQTGSNTRSAFTVDPTAPEGADYFEWEPLFHRVY